MAYVFTPPSLPSLPVMGGRARFPLRRIYCVGRNYSAHAHEMGLGESRTPFFFAKPADAAFVPDSPIPYPPATQSFHHEVELVVALGRGGANLAPESVPGLVFGYTVGVDLTRRDLQRAARERGQPWDLAKGFTYSAPCAPIRPAEDCFADAKASGYIRLAVNGKLRQHAHLEDMIVGVDEIISSLSRFDALAAGDIVFTGTPAGVGELVPGDQVTAEIENVGTLSFTIED